MASTLILGLLLLIPTAAGTEWGDNQCPACGVPGSDFEGQRELLLNLAKQSILDKLHLTQRPTLIHPVSRATLRTALRRLHNPQGRILSGTSLGGSEIGVEEQEYEIISFAETGYSIANKTVLDFRLSPDQIRTSLEVLQIRLGFFLQIPPNGTWSMSVKVLVPGLQDTNLNLTNQQQLEVDSSGWYQFLLGPEAQAAYSQGHLTLELEPKGWGAQSPVVLDKDAHQPFIIARVRTGEKHRIHRRGIECQGGSQMCCRQEFFIDFREIGWHDWIIQPEGYAMNFCTGQCPLHVAGMPGIAASFHTAVLNLLKANGAPGTAGGGSCCVPTARRPLSLLYYDRDSNIVKTDIPDMVVEACGCS
ncbi:inhibin beta C chain [Sarcophilus harrisii]|uniref:Inhibin subunit beta C n=1 Tax=Sarcophilus harrisii TaxID=9305 RepID=G3VW78_SARHA|nr:inhibin beta C chain [Sarcophilus harrisii]